jgi:hypothetical protein
LVGGVTASIGSDVTADARRAAPEISVRHSADGMGAGRNHRDTTCRSAGAQRCVSARARPSCGRHRTLERAGRKKKPASDATLGDFEYELLNRALYQPTIAVEHSPPTFSSVAEILSKAAVPGWVALVAERSRDPVAVLAAGGVVLALSVSKTIAGGAAKGLSDGLRERLYEWTKPTKKRPRRSNH